MTTKTGLTKLDGLNDGTFIVREAGGGTYRWDYFRPRGSNLGHDGDFPTASAAASDLLRSNGKNVQWQDGYDLLEQCREFDLRKRIERAA